MLEEHTRLQDAQQAHLQGKFQEAKRLYELVLQEEPGSLYALWGLAECCLGLALYAESLEHYNLVIRYSTTPQEIIAGFVAKASVMANFLASEDNNYAQNAREHIEKTHGYDYLCVPAMRLVHLQLTHEKHRSEQLVASSAAQSLTERLIGLAKWLFLAFFTPTKENWILASPDLRSFAAPHNAQVRHAWYILTAALCRQEQDEDGMSEAIRQAELCQSSMSGGGGLGNFDEQLQRVLAQMVSAQWRLLEHCELLPNPRLPLPVHQVSKVS